MFNNAAAFEPFRSAAQNEAAVDFDLDDRQVAQPGQRRVGRAEVIDRYPDIVELQLHSDLARPFGVADDLIFRDLDDEAGKARVRGQKRAHHRDELGLLDYGNRHVDGQPEPQSLLDETLPIRHGMADYKLGQRLKGRMAGRRQQVLGKNHAAGWMPGPHQCFGAAERQRLEIDLRLIPYLQPVVAQRVDKLNGGALWRLKLGPMLGDRGSRSPGRCAQSLLEVGRPKRLSKRHQHGKTVLLADLGDFSKRGFVATADEKDSAFVRQDFEMADDLDRVGLPKRKIEHDQFGRQLRERRQERLGRGELSGADAARAQHFADQSCDRGLVVEHVSVGSA